MDPASFVDGSITGYQISVTGMESVITARDVSSYEVAVPDDGSTEYSVSVAAMNVLGFGPTTTVGPHGDCSVTLVLLCFINHPLKKPLQLLQRIPSMCVRVIQRQQSQCNTDCLHVSA